MNSTDEPPANQQPGWVPEPESSKIIRLVLLGIIFVLAILGNLTVCILPFRNRRFRSFTYYLITNLAVSDIGAMLCLPYILLSELNDYRWTVGLVMCKLVNPSLTMFSVITTNTLVAIAMDRFIALVFPFRLRPGPRTAFLVITLAWFIAFLCILPSFGARVLIEDRYVYCMEVFPAESWEESAYYSMIYTIFMYLVNNLVPVVLIAVLYLIIIYRLRGLKLTRLYSRNHNLKAAKKIEARERKFTAMLAIVVLVFVVFYVPYQTFFLIATVNRELIYSWRYTEIGYRYLFLLMWVPNALNPICYGSMDAQYARAFKALLRCTSKSHQYVRERLTSVGSTYQWNSPKPDTATPRTTEYVISECPNSPLAPQINEEVRVTDV